MPDPNRQAASAELREFLSQMRGKSPREMLGAIASSNLVQSTFAATAAITAMIVLLTVVPFGWNKLFGQTAVTAAETAPTGAQNPERPLEIPVEPDLDRPAKSDAAGQLGIGESKQAPADVNPLESSTDNLLDGLE